MWQNREKGSSAVEFALILPVLMMILFGIIEFGLILYDKGVITNASREGARRGIVYREPGSITPPAVVDDIRTTVNNYAASYLISFGTAPAPVTAVTGDCFDGGSLTVTVTYPYTFLVLPNFADSLAEDLALSAVTVMNCENQL